MDPVLSFHEQPFRRPIYTKLTALQPPPDTEEDAKMYYPRNIRNHAWNSAQFVFVVALFASAGFALSAGAAGMVADDAHLVVMVYYAVIPLGCIALLSAVISGIAYSVATRSAE
jgi:hypothetical protein